MKKEDLFSDEFLKQFRNGKGLNGFLKDLQKRGIEKMLEGELDDHHGYDKNRKSDNPNTRNGYGQKKVRTSFGESEIQVPRDRNTSDHPPIYLSVILKFLIIPGARVCSIFREW
ncbi:transposase [Zunongwangia sp. F297]|uniref:Mutator family transposase n=1 Tax=Autumnicola edwardsiae TaxID=3075594 RepID=A0ABU3D0K8_9FLAO|nr:transposase [Zunongwangia sp. F297]MDT0651685.1 transposase [Zunongwangia sp. F297]